MANKRYYWLKLKEDFFDDDTIQFIEEQENGVYYVNFYLKLCLKSVKTEGKLIRLIGENLIPYDVKSLSKLTGTPVDTVKIAMALFERIGLVKVLETGEIFLSQIHELIGTETDKARIMREKRAKEGLTGNNVTQMLPECYTEKEKDIDIDKDTELKSKKKSRKKATEIATLPTLQELEKTFSNSLAQAAVDWFTYKQQRGETYTPIGLKSLLTQIKNNANQHGEQAVKELIYNCMGNNWKGIIFDKLKNVQQQYNTPYPKPQDTYNSDKYKNTGGYDSL